MSSDHPSVRHGREARYLELLYQYGSQGMSYESASDRIRELYEYGSQGLSYKSASDRNSESNEFEVREVCTVFEEDFMRESRASYERGYATYLSRSST